jgi:hypothetical protein
MLMLIEALRSVSVLNNAAGVFRAMWRNSESWNARTVKDIRMEARL